MSVLGSHFFSAFFGVWWLYLEINHSLVAEIILRYIHSCKFHVHDTTFQIKIVFNNVLFSAEVHNPLYAHLLAQGHIYVAFKTHKLKHELTWSLATPFFCFCSHKGWELLQQQFLSFKVTESAELSRTLIISVREISESTISLQTCMMSLLGAKWSHVLKLFMCDTLQESIVQPLEAASMLTTMRRTRARFSWWTQPGCSAPCTSEVAACFNR